ncbi:hypothetical protein ACLI09_04525 [Flavobacterium sp. RHBU_24]|uniref:hypothetical protein n=1 Tax=Flavobacterium sp. RHBU_24 TaxID=3391185 RepID=UPI0039851690
MKNKLLLAFIFIIVPVLLEGCCEDVHKYQVVPGNLTATVYNVTNFEAQDTLAFDDFCIAIDFPEADVNLLSQVGRLSFGASAYATSCADINEFTPGLDSVTITANRDYTEDYPAGTNLSHLFTAWYYSVEIANGQVSGNSYTSVLRQAVENVFIEKAYPPSANQLYLYYQVFKPTVPPSASGEPVIFTVSIAFKDGTVASSQTVPVTFA